MAVSSLDAVKCMTDSTIRTHVKILMVEDEENHAALIRCAFRSFSLPVSLTVATTLQQAKACLAESSLKCLFINILMAIVTSILN